MREAVVALLVTGLLAGVLPGVAAAAGIEVADTFPTRGEATELRVETGEGPLAEVVVEALYRPNSETASSEELPPTDDHGTVRWVPRDAGIVTLSVVGRSDLSRNVAVRFGTFPRNGVAIMIVAGLLLFGGAAFGFRMLLGPPRFTPEEEPPST